MSTAPTNSLIAHYFLGNCLVGTSNFVSGEIAFFDSLVNFVARDAAGNCTAVLPFDYLTLISFRIVKPKCRIRLELPIGFVTEWAETSGFGAECSQEQETIVLNLHFTEEDMSHFLAETAPVLAQNHARARSASRMSLPDVISTASIPTSHLQEQSVPTRASRTLPPSSQSQQEEHVAEGDGGTICGEEEFHKNSDADPEEAATQSQSEEEVEAAPNADSTFVSDIAVSNPSANVEGIAREEIDNDADTQDSSAPLLSDSEEVPSLSSPNLTTSSNIIKTRISPAKSLIDACISPVAATLSRKNTVKVDSNANEVSQLSEPTQHRDDDDPMIMQYGGMNTTMNVTHTMKNKGRKKQGKRPHSLSTVSSEGKAVPAEQLTSVSKSNALRGKHNNNNNCNDDDDDDYIFDMESIGIDSSKLFFRANNNNSDSSSKKGSTSSSPYFPHFGGLLPPPAKRNSRKEVTQKSLVNKATSSSGKAPANRARSKKLPAAQNIPCGTMSSSKTPSMGSATNHANKSSMNPTDPVAFSKSDNNDNITNDEVTMTSNSNETRKAHMIPKKLFEHESGGSALQKECEEPKTEIKPLKHARRHRSKSASYVTTQPPDNTFITGNKKTTGVSSLSAFDVSIQSYDVVDKELTDRINEESLTAMLTSGELEDDNSLDDFLVRAQLLVKKKRAEKIIRAASLAAESVMKGSGTHITVKAAEEAMRGYFDVNEGHRSDLFAYHSRRFSQLHEMTGKVKLAQANIMKTFSAEMGELSKCIEVLETHAGKLVEKLKKDEARWNTVDEGERAKAVSALQA